MAAHPKIQWHNIKLWLRYSEGVDKPNLESQFPLVFDLGADPGEHFNLFSDKLDMGWMFGLAMRAVGEFEKSVAQYPNSSPARSSPALWSWSGMRASHFWRQLSPR